jgi:hypothetical protein
MKQLLLNLVKTRDDDTPPEGVVEIARRPTREAWHYVATAFGIREDDIGRVFEPFTQQR